MINTPEAPTEHRIQPQERAQIVRTAAALPPSRPRANHTWAWKAGVIVFAFALTAAGVRSWLGNDHSESNEITAIVSRGDLEIIVSERGELESSKTVEA